MLKEADPAGVEKLRQLLREMLFQRLAKLGLARVTLDFDGSVQSTRRHAEGTAVGYNKKRKGARSYYPLFCTVAQTSQVLDFLHRSGNVHDSHGAREFILACIQEVRQALPGILIEVRMDSAFFSDEIITALRAAGIAFTVSVPFERFVQLKRMIEARQRWCPVSNEVSYFEADWKPKAWDRKFRFLFIRTRALRQNKEPIQLDLFVPHQYGYDFKVIITNKTLDAANVVAFHEGRGCQENLLGELKPRLPDGLRAHANSMRQPTLSARRPVRPQPDPRTANGHHPAVSEYHHQPRRPMGFRETGYAAYQPVEPRRPLHAPPGHSSPHPQCQLLGSSATARPPAGTQGPTSRRLSLENYATLGLILAPTQNSERSRPMPAAVRATNHLDGRERLWQVSNGSGHPWNFSAMAIHSMTSPSRNRSWGTSALWSQAARTDSSSGTVFSEPPTILPRKTHLIFVACPASASRWSAPSKPIGSMMIPASSCVSRTAAARKSSPAFTPPAGKYHTVPPS